MKIKDVELLTGISKANIRYYESQGLLFPNREANGYRTYDESHVRDLQRIKLLRAVGLSIESIKALRDGTATLAAALRARSAQFQAQHQALVQAESVIALMLEANSEFDTLNPEAYLAILDSQDGESAKVDIQTRPPLPFQRFWARGFDFALYALVLYLCVPSLFQTDRFNLLLILAEVVLLLLVEPVFLCLFSTTPGKWIFGITITNPHGKRLSYQDAANRTLLVLQHGLGFCLPFLRDYMQISSYTLSESGGELIWEQNSELNIRDEKYWRYAVFAVLLAAVMAYPAKMEFIRIFDAAGIETPAYEGVSPFYHDYTVEKVLYSADGVASGLPVIRMTADEMKFSYSGSTAPDAFETIGTFRHTPPEDDPAAGIWKLQIGAASDKFYHLQADGKGSVTLDCYDNFVLQWSWELTSLDVLQLEYKHILYRFYTVPEWFAQGSYDGNIDQLHPKRISAGTISLIFSAELPDSIVIQEEIHTGAEVKTNNVVLTKGNGYRYSFEFEGIDAENGYVLYRIPYAGGEYIFCILI
ncbi:MAG: MerR family transcriptional regulator [Oscillospiraceae bacterium]|nr:MerR family transcriptional regulator [Oscillospiraceae bacterium]